MSPYVVGGTIALITNEGSHIDATIIELKTFTLSCVAVVQIHHATLPSRCIVKFYDRRYSTQLRCEEDASSWSPSVEETCQSLVLSGEAERLFEAWTQKSQDDPFWYEEIREDWDDARMEAYLQFKCWRSYKTETHAYELLKHLQGLDTPRVLAHMVLVPSSPYPSDWPVSGKEFVCSGLLLEFIDGFALYDLGDHVSPEHWQGICNEAIDIVARAGESGICNRDVRTRNFIVQRQQDPDLFKVFMIDFGVCAFRSEAKSMEEFEEWHAYEDEEGAVGAVMQRKLGGRFNYCLSRKALYLLDKYMSED